MARIAITPHWARFYDFGAGRLPRVSQQARRRGTAIISERTVERHRANILGKLGMRDRVESTRCAIRRGLVEA
jgi:Bacterial regulatory proteins, luxR family